MQSLLASAVLLSLAADSFIKSLFISFSFCSLKSEIKIIDKMCEI